MNFRILTPLVLILATLFVGCEKKPRRPNPMDTVMGDGSSGQGQDQLDVTELGGDGTFAPGETGISGRGHEALDAADYAEIGERGILPTVYFQFDSASIQPAERPKLTRAAEFLKANPNAKILIEGHCDWRGTKEYNLALGDRRAKSAQSYLMTLGVSADRLITLSKGDLNAADGASSERMSQDRKAEIVVIR